MTTICRSGDLTVPPLVGCCLWNLGSWWMTDLKEEGCIPDDWRKSILVPVYKGKCDPLVCESYRAINLLEQPMKVLEQSVGKKDSDVRCQLITCSLASCLEREPLMQFSSCDKYKRNTKQRRRSCTMLFCGSREGI